MILGIKVNSRECDGKCLAHAMIRIPQSTKFTLKNWNDMIHVVESEPVATIGWNAF